MADPITIAVGDKVLGGTGDDLYEGADLGALAGTQIVDLAGNDTVEVGGLLAAADSFDRIGNVLTIEADGNSAELSGIETLVTDGGTLDLTQRDGSQYLLDSSVTATADNDGGTAATFGKPGTFLEFNSSDLSLTAPAVTWSIASVEGTDFVPSGGGVTLTEGEVQFGAAVDDLTFEAAALDIGLTETQDVDIDVVYENDANDVTFAKTFTVTVEGDNSGDDVVFGDGDPTALDDVFGDDGDATTTDTPLGEGNDQFFGREADDLADGEAGEDLLVGGNGADELDGGADDDEIYGGRGDDNDGLAVVSVGVSSATLTTSGNGALLGGEGDDFVNGGLGDDGIEGGAGVDKLNGGNGDDIIFGDAGNDEVFGGDGDDTLVGGTGNDTLVGGFGDDVIDATGGGANDIFGGAGDDTILASTNSDTIAAGKGDDVISGNGGEHTFKFFADSDKNVIVDWGDGSQIDISSFDLSEAEVAAALSTGEALVANDGTADFAALTSGDVGDSVFTYEDFSLVVDAVELTTDDFII